MSENPQIVVIGGGTGSFTLLQSLKDYTKNITAIVNMADDGGSTGVLRDELGALPPGDVRQCLVALSDTPKMRDLFNYRFDSGTFEGHAFGNLFLTALEKVTGNFLDAVETASDVLRINGRVVPATLSDVRLKMEWHEASVLRGERVIDADHFADDPRKASLSLVPRAIVNPDAIKAIENAEIIVIAPGDLYTSLGPLLIIEGIGAALEAATAQKIYVANLVTKRGQTEGFSVADHASEIERFAGRHFLNHVLYNSEEPGVDVKKRYEAEGAYLVRATKIAKTPYKLIAGSFLGAMASAERADKLPVTRSLIRHDSPAIARAIMNIYDSTR